MVQNEFQNKLHNKLKYVSLNICLFILNVILQFCSYHFSGLSS